MGSTNITFSHQSQEIGFSEWVSLLTLCLAPLIAHILAGVPSPVYLCANRPRWHDRLVHFNPTSILWRYFVITDRRARSKKWTVYDMFGSNALFWTQNGWDGSEQMIQSSVRLLTQKKRRSHVEIMSISAFKTIIVTFQGVQALTSLLYTVAGRQSFGYTVSFDTLFFPLATFGLLRLPAALWLSDEKVYHSEDELSTSHKTQTTGAAEKCQPFAILSNVHEECVQPELYPMRGWRGIAVRLFFVLMVSLLWTISLVELIPLQSGTNFSALTAFSLNILYFFFLSVTMSALAFYILRGSSTTIIPCSESLWYKIYTGVLFTGMLFVLITAAIETRKTPCGRFTTLSSDWDLSCGSSTYVTADGTSREWPKGLNDRNQSWPIGLIGKNANGTFEAKSFNGFCLFSGPWKSAGLLYGNMSAVENESLHLHDWFNEIP
jgi:hypothetical protein